MSSVKIDCLGKYFVGEKYSSLFRDEVFEDKVIQFSIYLSLYLHVLYI